MADRRTRTATRRLAELDRRSQPLPDDALTKPTLVCAPHPDDETLGCGGTIARLRDRGSPVTVAILSRGERSHAHLMDRDRLAALRADEARAALRVLGVDDVELLGLPDGQLEEHHEVAAERLAKLVDSRRPEQVLVPFHMEAVADHLATRTATLDALRRVGRPVDVLEFPVWFWTMVPARRSPRWGLRGRLNRLLDATLPRTPAALDELDTHVDLGDALQRKHTALAEHRSQMSRLVDDPRWLTLTDVDGGHLLRMALQPRERFCRRRLLGSGELLDPADDPSRG